jgi:pimeloyl-ACP methyl ester carboxylesterase
VYSLDEETWKTSLAFPGELKKFHSSDKELPMASFITPADKAHHHAVFGNDYSICLNWYHRGINNLGVAEEKALLEKGEIKDTLDKETLFFAGLKDAISPAVWGKQVLNATVEKGKLRIVDVEAGHWIMLEKSDELNRALEEFLVSDD